MLSTFLLVSIAVASTETGLTRYPMSLNSLNLNGLIDSFVLPIFVESPPTGDPLFVRLATWENTNLAVLPGFLERVFKNVDHVSCRLSESDIWTGSISSVPIPSLPVGAVGSLGCGPLSPFAQSFGVFSLRTHARISQAYSILSLGPLERCTPSYNPIIGSGDAWLLGAAVELKLSLDVDGEVWKKIPLPVDNVEISNRPVSTLDEITWQLFSRSVYEQADEWQHDSMGRIFTENSSNCRILVTQKFPRLSIKFTSSDTEHEIGPEQYLISGNPKDPNSGCTINVVKGDIVSTGSPFLMEHSVEYDAINKRIGIC